MLIIYLFFAVVLIVVLTTKLSIHPFLSLLITAILFGIVSGMPLELIITSINDGFGKTLGSIGLVILLGVMIGTFLENSGGAYRLANRLLKWLGEKNVHWAMALIGYVVSIPVFADSGFVILTPLNKALTKKAGMSMAVTAVALSMGLMATHVMVPPTPGPIATASILGADLGLVILWGFMVSFLSLIPCVWYAKKMGDKIWIEPDVSENSEKFAENVLLSPSFLKSVLPIIVPLLLIVVKSFNDYLQLIENERVNSVINFVGEPVIALLIGFGFALLLPKKLDKALLSDKGWVGKAILDAATIIMITGAGGVFGKVLQNAGLADFISENLSIAGIVIFLPFLLAAAIKTAQGSSTVAMITTASIIAPLTSELGIVSANDLALTTLVIGAGAAVISHVNDSFFWVVTQLSGMDVKQGYKLHSAASAILGGSAFLIVWLLMTVF
ncbi:MAG: GntP family permease [Spirosomaceae bacterium]|nr:GntP family permease [Spirosomataceae bacterium]